MAVCFFFNDTATTEIYTLSLHDALPICQVEADDREQRQKKALRDRRARHGGDPDRAAHVLDEGLLPGHELPDERSERRRDLDAPPRRLPEGLDGPVGVLCDRSEEHTSEL